MSTLKHGRSKFNRRKAVKQKKQIMKNWVSAYLSALFEDREVEVLPQYQRELDLLLW